MHRTDDFPKPAHLRPTYGMQFEDGSVAGAYYARPPYPSAFFELLGTLLTPGRRWILELGSGTGDATLGMLSHADQIDAVEPSLAMLSVAQRRLNGDDPRIRWVHATSEQADFHGPYSMVIAAESLHWMEWSKVLPRVAAALAPGAFLVIAERGHFESAPWHSELNQLIAKHSTNQEFHPYDLIDELTIRGLFKKMGRCSTVPVPFVQSIEDHIELMHSRNGFSRNRMPAGSAAEFDTAFRQLLERYCFDGFVRLQTVVTLTWGAPRLEQPDAPNDYAAV